MTKPKLPSTHAIDRLIAESKSNSSNKLELLGMAEGRVQEIDADIQRNPHKHPGKNPLATAVLKEGLATIKAEQATTPKRPTPAPARPAPAPAPPANKFAKYDDAACITAATHKCSPPADKAAAVEELAKRNITIGRGVACKSYKV